jgi:hypothetical protein
MSDGAGAPGRVRLAVPSVRVVAGLCLSTLIAGLGAVAVSAQGSGGCALTGFSPGSGLIWESDADLVRDLDEMVAVGGQWLRIDVAWSSTEPQKGTFQWGPVDRVVNAASSRGIKIIGLLHLTPAWARAAGTDSAMYPPLNPAEFANIAKLATERYSTKVKVWEIWNEPNIPVFWRPKPDVAAYTALLKPAYAAIKAADSGATVLSAGLSPAVDAPDGSEVSPATYLTGVYQNGGKGSFDAVAVHPYSYPARPLDPATAHYNTFSARPS